jgi:transposase
MAGARRQCGGCGRWCEAIHDVVQRRVRDLPIFEVPVELVVPRVRVLCPGCGPKLEHLSWLRPHSRVTERLAASVARLCKLMAVRHVADFYGLAWTTVKLIDQRHLERELGPISLEGVRVIAMDEFAIHKGHRYATVIVEPYRKQVLWLGLGRGRADVRPARACRSSPVAGGGHGHERWLSRGSEGAVPAGRHRLRPVPCHRQVRPPSH